MIIMQMSWRSVIHKPPVLIYSVSGRLTSDSATRSDQISYTNEHDFLWRLKLHQNSCTVKINFLVGPTLYGTEDSIFPTNSVTVVIPQILVLRSIVLD